jgi:hypothetical protein
MGIVKRNGAATKEVEIEQAFRLNMSAGIGAVGSGV